MALQGKNEYSSKIIIEYYPFGLQTANSWTRDNTTNNFLYNQGSELNSTTGFYDLPYRNYDAALGRFFQVDPLATSSHSMTPYHYAGNNPIGFNDPMGLMKMNPYDPDYALKYGSPSGVGGGGNTGNQFTIDYSISNDNFEGQNVDSWNTNNSSAPENTYEYSWQTTVKDENGNIVGYKFYGQAARDINEAFKSSTYLIVGMGSAGGLMSWFNNAINPSPPPVIAADDLQGGHGHGPNNEGNLNSDVGGFNPWKYRPGMMSGIKDGSIAWQIDKEGKHTGGGTMARTVPVDKFDKNTALTVYVNPDAFNYGADYLASVVGHEWIHVAQYRSNDFSIWAKQYGELGADQISEEKAWRWTRDTYPDATGANQLSPYQQWSYLLQNSTPRGYVSSPFYSGYY